MENYEKRYFMNIREKVDRVMEYTSYSNRKKIDTLLFLNADQYCNLGKDCSKSARSIAEANSRYIYKQIRTLDLSLGKLLLRYREE